MGRVLHASYSGYFPFCINNPEIIALYQEEIDQGNDPMDGLTFRGSLEQLMYMFWVVKTISVSFSGTDDTGSSFAEFFTITADQPLEENIVCGKSFSTTNEVVTEQGGITYFGPFFVGVLGLPDGIYAGGFNWRFFDPGGRYAVEMGKTLQSGPGRSMYLMNLGAYSISVPILKTEFVVGTYSSFSATATSWFGYDGIWNENTGQRL